MGSFDYTCAISGLPIAAGDPVRFILLQSSPFNLHGNYACDPESWYLRTPAIKAKYNDYGLIEEIDPKDKAIQELFLESFQIDLIEKGVGNNTCHDVALRKNMNFSELLTALWEDRVEVKPDIHLSEHRAKRQILKKFGFITKLSKGIPSIKRVEKIIDKFVIVKFHIENRFFIRNNFKTEISDSLLEEIKRIFISISESEFILKSNNFIVDKLRRGEIRVRMSGYPSFEVAKICLSLLAKKLKCKYNVMLTCGSGSYSERMELIVHPKLGTKESQHYFCFRNNANDTKEPKSLRINYCMVREDVWQELLTMKLSSWNSDCNKIYIGIDEYRKSIKQSWNKFQKNDNINKYLPDKEGLYNRFIRDNPSITAFGLDTFWNLMNEKTNLSKNDIDNFCNSVAEISFISDILAWTRKSWDPVGFTSPQFGEWKLHKIYYQKILKVISQKLKHIKY